MATTYVTFQATPQSGACSSQPMFINRAWIIASDTIKVPTNSTYHQGACVGVITFSAGLGGTIHNAGEQALDYKTSPLGGIIIAPDEGYRFTGWSHDMYVSLRGELISAQNNIMYYDTLPVYGNVELQANFEPKEYPIRYHLNGSINHLLNPETYTIKSGDLLLKEPEKEGDIFIGWTGSNGEKPRITVRIPEGSTGELEFYANFLHSGKDKMEENPSENKNKIWATGHTLYIRVSEYGSMIRIYSADGTLQVQQVAKADEITKINLRRGIYIVTINNHVGQKIRIE